MKWITNLEKKNMDSNNFKKCSKFLIIRNMQINIETLLPASENSYH